MIFRNSTHAPFMKKRFSIEEIKARIVDESFELVSIEYINAHEKLEWHCLICGNNFFSNWCNISNGWKCPKCKAIAASENMRTRMRGLMNIVSENEVLSAVESKKLDLLSNLEGVNAKTKLTLRCGLCGNIFQSQAGDICRKWKHPGCWDCSRPKRNKGGEHLKPYPKEWNTRLKESIRNRDERTCQFPNCEYTDVNRNAKLHVHHINGIKTNCEPYNLISLCEKHHVYVEWNDPDDWQEYFYSVTADYEYR